LYSASSSAFTLPASSASAATQDIAFFTHFLHHPFHLPHNKRAIRVYECIWVLNLGCIFFFPSFFYMM
jgi:hypothetical protein